MRKALFTFILFTLSFSLYSQSSFRVKVIDAQTSENIEKAIVFIEEIPLPDQETDRYGVVFFQNVPEDRKVRVNVRKKGYLPKQIEIVANRAIKVDNNIIIKLDREPISPKIIFYGEVNDQEGNDVQDAIVEISILGKPYTAKTDESGNYQISIDGSLLESVSSFHIEVKKTNCEKYKSSEAVPKSEIINKDIKLNCPGDNRIGSGHKPGGTVPIPNENSECEIRKTGNLCFYNASNEKRWVYVDGTYERNSIILGPGQTQCLYDISIGSHEYYACKRPIYNQGSLIEKGQILVQKCKSTTFTIK